MRHVLFPLLLGVFIVAMIGPRRPGAKIPAPTRRTSPSCANAWSACRSRGGMSPTAGCSRRCARCRGTASCRSACVARLTRTTPADRRGPDDIAAVHRRDHVRAAATHGRREGSRGRHRVGLIKRPSSPSWRKRSTRSRSRTPCAPGGRNTPGARLHRCQGARRDGYLGWPEAAPFDAIIVTAAPDTSPSR